MKEKEELVTLAQIAETSPESKEFWDEYRERMELRESTQKGLVEARPKAHS